MVQSSSLDDLLARFEKLHPKKIDLSLMRIEALLEKLGHPHMHLPPVVHVAGTNGKGSTIAFLRAMLEAAGYRVHVYTSPHLIRFNERIYLAGRYVSDFILVEALEEVERVNGDHPITFFEITTAAAFLLFARTPADIVLLETGLGGRLDATNVVPNPAVTAITRISIDHTEFLGNTLEKIAAEKADIMKPGVPCIIAPQYDDVILTVLKARAHDVGAPIFLYGRDWQLQYPNRLKEFKPKGSHQDNAPEQNFALFAKAIINYPLPSYLIGAHQIINAGVALMCLDQLQNFDVPHVARVQGLQSAKWPGRLEYFGAGTIADRLPDGTELWFDGAHNDSGVDVLADQLKIWSKMQPTKSIIVVMGMLTTKDPGYFMKTILPHCDALYFTRGDNDNFFKIEELLQIAAYQTGSTHKIKNAIQLDYQSLQKIAQDCPQSRIIVCGSLYLRTLLEKKSL